VFEKGTYHFNADFASEKYAFVSNNDEGLKRFTFDLSGMENLEIDGQGSSFIFDGFVSPFLLLGSKNITLKNFSIDYKRTFHSEGKIVGAYQDSLDIAFSAEYPYQISHNKLLFTGDKVIGRDNGGEPQRVLYPFWHLLEYEATKREPLQNGGDYLNTQNMNVKELSPGVVRIHFPRIVGTVGNTMIFNAMDRACPAFIITESESVKFNDITIYHAGGVGILGQRSKNIFLDGVKVIAKPGRMVSTTADATHFVNCEGKITLQNSVFESMMDDATNIHGIYVKIMDIISPKEVMVKLIHYQQFGFDFLKPGLQVELANAQSLNTYGNMVVNAVERINKEYTRVTFKEPIFKDVKVGDVIASSQAYPEVLMKNCRVLKNRARGILLGSRAKTVIENNYFHTQCPAINLEGDGRFWFEQAGVRDLTIRNNMFDNCNYSLMLGLGVITASSGIEESSKEISRYNRNILIEGNTFKLVTPNILKMYSVDNLVYKNNKAIKSNEYPMPLRSMNLELKPFMIEHSSNITIKE
ncbi:MAG TPA: right-handed parallel beta-helix repeat-containing protein, partial [Pelobium sp.]